jgi:hypothetical protein
MRRTDCTRYRRPNQAKEAVLRNGLWLGEGSEAFFAAEAAVS